MLIVVCSAKAEEKEKEREYSTILERTANAQMFSLKLSGLTFRAPLFLSSFSCVSPSLAVSLSGINLVIRDFISHWLCESKSVCERESSYSCAA